MSERCDAGWTEEEHSRAWYCLDRYKERVNILEKERDDATKRAEREYNRAQAWKVNAEEAHASLARVREALNDAPNTHPAFIVNEIYRALEGGEGND